MKAVGGIVPSGFEYFLEVESRLPVRDQIWDQWNRSLSEIQKVHIPKASLSRDEDHQEAEDTVRRLQAVRIDIPVRLRE